LVGGLPLLEGVLERLDDHADVRLDEHALPALDLPLAILDEAVDAGPAGGVVDDRVEALVARALERGSADRDRCVAGAAAHDRNLEPFPQLLELLRCGGALHVGSDQQRALALGLQPARELAGDRRLADALEPDQHHAGEQRQLAATARRGRHRCCCECAIRGHVRADDRTCDCAAGSYRGNRA